MNSELDLGTVAVVSDADADAEADTDAEAAMAGGAKKFSRAVGWVEM